MDGELVCDDAHRCRGQTECDITVSGSSSIVRVEVADPDGYTDEDVVLVVDPADGTPANTPDLRSAAPPSGSMAELGAVVELRGLVGDAEDAPRNSPRRGPATRSESWASSQTPMAAWSTPMR